MFDFLSGGHLLVIALGALFILGPERLPTVAQDAARATKRLRSTIEAARLQLHDSLGDDLEELRGLDPRRYHPKTFLRKQLFGDPSSVDSSAGARPPTGPWPSTNLAPSTVGRPAARQLPPPIDWDAT